MRRSSHPAPASSLRCIFRPNQRGSLQAAAGAAADALPEVHRRQQQQQMLMLLQG